MSHYKSVVQVAAHEAMCGKQLEIARVALQHLQGLLASAGDSSSTQQGKEATVLCNLVRMTEAAAEAGLVPKHKELALVFEKCMQRIREVGASAFFVTKDSR